ncbi:hypothetical protein QTO34_009681 [Cnephaeus nilssonii]|uniref:Uncharacterized protein n=1 Tax=Cnephaeus nilssonii TaxID=3371016 RepID=A0AA40HIY9_CNENI|nr:hypothetical protein QTO34_009681 [Eptesicus nilssonii]
MASGSGAPPFRLETYDGGPEDGADVDKGKRGLGAALPPMESPYVGEDRNFSPQIKVNLNYRKGAGASSGVSRFALGRRLRGLPACSAHRASWKGSRDERSLGAWLVHSISHKPHSRSQDPNRFDRDRLFSAVARGVPQDLAGLPEYLRATSKYLTDSEYTGKLSLREAQ